MRNILLTIAYDGSGFSGWQRQKACRTVQGDIEAALLRLTGKAVELTGCSRTDAGVHAVAQRAGIVLEDGGIPTGRIAKALNDILAFDRREGIGDIKIIEAVEMPEGFHARYSARGKRYIYRIYNSEEKSPFRLRQFYQVGPHLDLSAMREAAKYIEGRHDFKCFETSGASPRKSSVRTVFEIEISETLSDEKGAREIIIKIEGDGFLYNMVRIIAGTLVEVGLHKRRPEELRDIIEGKDRGKAGHTAPPQGLYLDEVFY